MNMRTSAIATAEKPFRVGLLPIPGFALMAYACTVEPLRAANLLSGKTLYEVTHFGVGTTSQSSGAAGVTADARVGETPALDLLLVIAGGDPFAFDHAETLNWLKSYAGTLPQIGGVSGGAVILAHAGLMADRRMTVHWEHGAELAERYPELLIDRRLYVFDRDRVTCGGGTAPLDMMHALITDHHGSGFARQVSDWFLHTEIRAATAPQRALASARLGRAAPNVSEAVTVMETHIADPLTLDQLALTVGISARQLSRAFRQTTGTSVMSFYRQLRLDVGRRLVTGTALDLTEIAEATGFGTASHFSNGYLRAFGQRPRQDRNILG